MPKSVTRTYSAHSKEAVKLLANMLRIARIEQALTTQEVSERAGISRGLLQRIEKGDMKCEIGVVFEVARIVGVKLFDMEATTLTRHLKQSDAQIALLPKHVKKARTKVVDDEF